MNERSMNEREREKEREMKERHQLAPHLAFCYKGCRRVDVIWKKLFFLDLSTQEMSY
jgi:hypothetical protein